MTVYYGHNSPSGANTNGVNYPVQTNQVISLVGYDWADSAHVFGNLADGTRISLTPLSFETLPTSLSAKIPQVVTGLTNINVTPISTGGWATFEITTPSNAMVGSNYIPADAVVIPASATGNVQIILESSPDLLNWTAADPGTYGASSATNRFFRVRAVVTP